ncbi:MAG: NAD(P)/FAD-dependent oxidoreductase [Alphaproteobacteria bacterium]|nr:NAD(P)/FAD-dependent oxidoreductase [Alphaproteobacteria bacterium]
MPEIVIVGGGFGGIALAIALKNAGISSFTIVERAADIGGVWRENVYPGAACDVPSRLYSFSFEQDYPWSSHCAPQAEILGYVRHCVEKYGLAPHLRFGTEIVRAAFSERDGRWTLVTRDGATMTADVFVSAVGLFNRPAFPTVPGREDFAGMAFHSARWNHDYDLAGKSVAVIGTGASAIQFVPAIAATVGRLHVFQRSAQYIFPRGGPADPAAWTRQDALARRLERLKLFVTFEKGGRRRHSERATAKGETGFLAYLAAKVPDPLLRRALTPDYPLGCKRVLRSDDYYDAIQRPNVALITTPVARILANGIRTEDGMERPVDAIIYGTGFTPTDYLTPMAVSGHDGRDLNDAWRDGAEAYLGITVAGFPNFFMLYGPNTNVAGSVLYMLESQARYITACIQTLAHRHARSMNLRADAQTRFNAEIQRRLAGMVLTRSNCHSYFRTETGKVTTNWPGFMAEYRLRTRRVREADYEFDAVPATAATR